MKLIHRCKLASIPYLLTVLVAFAAPSHALAELIRLDTDTGFDSVYLLNNPNAVATRVALTFLVGEVDVNGPEGLSHYLEHLVFLQAYYAGSEQIHARWGNAFANPFITSYFNQSEQSDIDDMLLFVQGLFETPIENKGFAIRERSVVAREYDVGVSENPNRRILTKTRRTLYNNLPLTRSVIGTPKSISSFTLARAAHFHKRFYHPANSVLYISGALEKADAEVIVNEQFGDIEPGPRHSAQWRKAKISEPSDTVESFTDSQVNFERLYYQTLSEWPEDKRSAIENWYTLSLLQSVLDSALEGGVARPLRMDDFILRSFAIELNAYLSDYFELFFYAEPDNGVSLNQATTAINDTLSALAVTGISDATLERVRSRMLKTENRISGDDNSNYDRMSAQLASGLNPADSREHINHIQNVSLKDVNAMLRALADPMRRAVAHISPNGE